jgi:hypothetical protein
VWLHVVVRDASGRLLFESGAVERDGRIRGNDNDDDGSRHEPHYDTIRESDQVQIYESIMVDDRQRITTGLLQASAFVKDNRLLPRGFEKADAPADVAVRGEAADDPDFAGAGDRVSYVIDVTRTQGPFDVTVELRYQPVAFRWAQNLQRYDAPEPRRFVAWYDAMATGSSAVLARATQRVD